MHFTDVLYVMAESIGAVHPEERETLLKVMMDALVTIYELSDVGRDIIVNTIEEHDGDIIGAITELLNEDD